MFFGVEYPSEWPNFWITNPDKTRFIIIDNKNGYYQE
jgi:hypothetical protein